MSEANALPPSNKLRSSLDHILVHCKISAWRIGLKLCSNFRKVRLNRKVQHLMEQFCIPNTWACPPGHPIPGLENFKRSKPEESLCNAQDYGCLFIDYISIVENIPHHLGIRGDNGPCSSGGNPKVKHGLTAEVLPQRRSQDLSAICSARVRSFSCPFELDFPTLALWVNYFSQVHGGTITQLTREGPKLMPTVTMCCWLCARKHLVPTKIFCNFRPLHFFF
mmetsp:Transcript_25712/g.33685  ORF Transcript_25712/g.33685 Transcript_25712/m.33685 type:complete len:222 (-) Transcript_25712:527-1192(-)